MPQNFEQDFLKTVRDRRLKKQEQMAKRIGLVLLALAISTMLYFIARNTLQVGFNHVTIGLFIVLLILLIPIGIAFKKSLNQDETLRVYFDRLKKIKPKHWVGYSLLLVTFIYYGNPALLNNFTLDVITHFRYNPKPPTASFVTTWKSQPAIHPIVANLKPEIEKSIQSVAEYINQNESDPQLKIKALHDYVIRRVSYDIDVLKTGIRPSQDAQTVFKTGKAVCEGYAKLFEALGKSIGLEVVYLEGKVRKDLAPLSVIPKASRIIESRYDWTGHAWNAIKVGETWQLVDTTWDDSESGSYRTEYLMPLPQVMLMSHFPNGKAWQLLSVPKSADEFERQPLLTPQFFRSNLTIVSPQIYETRVKGIASIELKDLPNEAQTITAIFSNRKEEKLSLWNLPSINPFAQEDQANIKHCKSTRNAAGLTQISCQFPEPGDYQVLMYSRPVPDRLPTSQGQSQGRSEGGAIGQLRFLSS
jgi:hypothetical protein